MELAGMRERGRPKRRFMDAVRKDRQVVGVRVEDTENRVKWETSDSLWQPPKRDKPKGDEDYDIAK